MRVMVASLSVSVSLTQWHKGKLNGHRVDLERVDHWIGLGAKTSDRVKRLLKDARRNAMADRMVVGRIRSPYGIQGWVWMDSFTNDPASVFEWTPWVLKRAPDRVSGRPAID